MIESRPPSAVVGTNDRRPEHVAGLGFLLQVAAFGTLLGIGLWAKSDASIAVARFVVAGIPIWGILYLAFKQMRRVRSEEMETAELLRTRAAGLETALFEVDQDALLLERSRLHWMLRWLLPGTTILVAAYLLAGHFVGWKWSLADAMDPAIFRRTKEPILVMWFVVGVGFLCFLYARYALALARLPEFRLLHAGASIMAGNALACLGLVLALMASSGLGWAEPVLAYIIRVALLVIGVEFAVNFILDLYRPRTSGEIPRPSFDSRLLGLLSEPGGVAKSIADAVNYQFGFEVSSTWIYQLLQRWFLPLTIAASVFMFLLTSLVIVEADEAAVIERQGRLLQDKGAVWGPGLHFKLPYPIDVVRRVPIGRIRELTVGEASQSDGDDPSKAIVWTEAHDYVPELMLPVASPSLAALSAEERDRPGAQAGRTSESSAVSLLMVSVPIEYRVRDPRKFLYTHEDPLKVLEATAYQILSEYAAGVDVDQLMGPGRERFNRDLHGLLQKRLDELEVGIEIVFVGIRAAHPPSDQKVADAFQGVISSQIKGSATVYAAVGEAQRIHTAVAGTEARAKMLDEAIRARDRLAQDRSIAHSQEASAPDGKPDPAPVESKEQEAERLAAEERVRDLLLGNPAKGIAPMSGRASAIVAASQADAREWMGQEAAKFRAFETEVAAYKAAPLLYPSRKMLEVYEDLATVRKYLIVGDPSNVVIEYETTEQGGIDRVLNEASEGKKRSEGP